MNLIEAQSISKKFGGVQALLDVDFSVQTGEIFMKILRLCVALANNPLWRPLFPEVAVRSNGCECALTIDIRRMNCRKTKLFQITKRRK